MLRPAVRLTPAWSGTPQAGFGRDHEIVGIGIEHLRDKVLAHLGTIRIRGVDQVDAELEYRAIPRCTAR